MSAWFPKRQVVTGMRFQVFCPLDGSLNASWRFFWFKLAMSSTDNIHQYQFMALEFGSEGLEI